MSRKKPKLVAPKVCPVCGEDVHRGALACPECGADHNSGWRADAGTYDGLGLPDDDFDYDEFVRGEFGSGSRPAGFKAIWWSAAVLLILVLVIAYLVRAWP